MADRIDKYMVEKGMIKTRSQASMLISQGDVYCNGEKVTKTSKKVSDEDKIEIKQEQLYVSRGAYKLKSALEEFSVSVDGKTVADIGASTGGFTQVCLDAGANKVYAVDVGHDQLSEFLKSDDRVVNMEGKNIKFPLELSEKVDLCVVDLSFISIKLVFKNIFDLLNDAGKAIVLIKPQFEAGKSRIGKSGLVKDSVRVEVVNEVREWFAENNYSITAEMDSPITGNKSGNTEYLWLIEHPTV